MSEGYHGSSASVFRDNDGATLLRKAPVDFFIQNAISRRNGDEILPEFREHVQKCLNSLRIAENLQNFDLIPQVCDWVTGGRKIDFFRKIQKKLS